MKEIRRKELRFPTMLRRMWSGGDVQDWIDTNIKPLFSKIIPPHIHDEKAEEEKFQAWWESHGQYLNEERVRYLSHLDAWNACSARIAEEQAQVKATNPQA